jgi:hypothetical protein
MLVILFGFAKALLATKAEERGFLAWMRETGEFYTGDEFHMRFGIWITNFRYVQEHNAGHSFTLGMNQFAALTPGEYRARLRPVTEVSQPVARRLGLKSIPDSFDWRDKGVVLPVTHEHHCFLAFASSIVDAMAGADAIATKSLKALSVEFIISCQTGTSLCNLGEDPQKALQWVIGRGGTLPLSKDYPYQPEDPCHEVDPKKEVHVLSRVEPIAKHDEVDLAEKCVKYGPISAMVDASQPSFQLYQAGVYDEPNCGINLDLEVSIVGYGKYKRWPFWIVKNCWGTGWGEEGYIRMLKDEGDRCGMASHAVACIP